MNSIQHVLLTYYIVSLLSSAETISEQPVCDLEKINEKLIAVCNSTHGKKKYCYTSLS